MKLGAEEKKKVWALSILGFVALYLIYTNVIADSSPSAPPPAPKPAATTARERAIAAAATSTETPASAPQPSTAPRAFAAATHTRSDEFHPALHSKRKEDQIDPMTVDPTLRLDLLAKVQGVKLDGGQRNLFQFGDPEPAAVAKLVGPEAKVVPKPREKMGPREYVPPVPPPPPPPPQAAPFTPKYYGLATKRVNGKKTAFFLDGEDIILANEGMTVKRHFRIVRINADTVVIEDTDVKRDQTVRISEDAGGAQ